MGIFKSITKVLKKAAPLIGSTIGFALGGPGGAAIGSGIGSLASGRSVQDSLLNAGLAYGVGSFAKGAGFTKAPDSATGISKFLPGRQVAGADFGTTIAPNLGIGAENAIPMTDMLKTSGNSIFKFIGENPLLTAGGVGTLLAGAMGEGEQKGSGIKMQPYPVGKTRLGTGRIGNKLYNLDDPDERRQYFEDNRKRREPKTVYSAAGGEVNGPGTGTSDSVPARLSDGEFVVTAKAVRGAGGGDRDVGAARMYDMMSQLERVA